MKIILCKLFLLVIICNGQEDESCDDKHHVSCVAKETCESYNNELANLKTMKKCSCEYKTKLTELKSRICNKKNGKVCCDPVSTRIEPPPPPPQQEQEDYQCGLRKAAVANIAGGEGARPGDWPWMARLLYPNRARVMCGGTLVTRRHVVTAAHCVAEVEPDKVILGDTIISTDYDCIYPDQCKPEIIAEDPFFGSKECFEDDLCAPKHVERGVKDINSHESFNWCPPQSESDCFPKFDVALVTLDSPVTFSSYIQPVCLPAIGAEVKYKFMVVTGWGNTNREFGVTTPADVLQKLDVFHEPLDKCNQTLRTTMIIDDSLLPSHVCVKTRESTSTCRGDSGGPMVRIANLRTGSYELAGIISFGLQGCGDSNFPMGLTRVPGEVSSWLRDQIGSQNLPTPK